MAAIVDGRWMVPSEQIACENELAVAFRLPKEEALLPGHAAVVPKKACPSFCEADLKTCVAMYQLAQQYGRNYPGRKDGFTIHQQTDEVAGRKLKSMFLQVFPRVEGDLNENYIDDLLEEKNFLPAAYAD